MKTYNSLRARLRAFVRAFVETGVGTRAMKAIKFEGLRPETAASKLLAKPGIRQAIAEYEAHIVDEGVRQRVFANLNRLLQIRDFDPRQLVDPTGRPRGLHELTDEVAAAIQSVEIEEYIDKAGQFVRRYKYKAAGKIEAGKLIAQFQHVLVQKHEHTGPNGQPLQPPTIAITFPDGGPGATAPAEDGVETS